MILSTSSFCFYDVILSDSKFDPSAHYVFELLTDDRRTDRDTGLEKELLVILRLFSGTSLSCVMSG